MKTAIALIFISIPLHAIEFIEVENCVAESGSESFEGKVAVHRTVLSRLKASRHPTNTTEIILKPYAFSWTKYGEAKSMNYKQFLECHKAIEQATRLGPWPYRHYYANKGANAIPPPSWALEAKQTLQIGNHLFLSGVK